MGFFRKQEEKLAIRLLAWRYQNANQPLPPYAQLEAEAARVVEEAHRIAKERGSNVVSIIKDLAQDIKKKD